MFKRHIKNFIDENKEILIITTAAIAVFSLFLGVILKKEFFFTNDQLFQLEPFYREYINLIMSGEFPMYSWRMFLGTDFYSAMGYYCVGDVFLPLLIILKNHLHFALELESIACIYLAGIFFNYYLKEAGINSKTSRIFISLVYALGGAVSGYLGMYMFERFLAFLPLMFYGLHRYFNKGRKGAFILAVAVLFLQNYYFMWPVSIYLLLYCLVYEFKQKRKEIIKDFLRLMGGYLTGLLISAVVLVPSVLYLIHNPRVGDTGEMSLFWDFKVYAGLLVNLVVPNMSGIIDSPFFIMGSGHEINYYLFIGIVPLVMSLDYLTDRRNRTELILVCVLLAFIIFKPLSSLMHGLSNPSMRWTFVLELFLLEMAARSFETFSQKKAVRISLIYGVLFLCVAGVAVYLYGINNCPDYVKMLAAYFIAAVLILAVCLRKPKAGMVLLTVEMLIANCHLAYLKTRDFTYIPSVIRAEYLNDDGFYRIYTNPENYGSGSSLQLNESLNGGFMTSQTYSTTLDWNIQKFIEMNSLGGWDLNINNPYSLSILGTKYYLVSGGEEIPWQIKLVNPYEYEWFRVFENLSSKGFGYCQNEIRYTKNFSEPAEFEYAMFVDDETFDIRKYENGGYPRLTVTDTGNNYLKGNITLEKANILMIPVPDNPGWKVRVNGTETDTISVNGGFMGLALNEGVSEIEMTFTSPGIIPGAVLSVLGIILFILELRRRKND